MDSKLYDDIIQWDVKTWKSAIDFWETKVNWESVGNALELGGREGGLSLWLALKGKKVVCSDLSNVKSTAESLHQKYNVCSLIEYQDIDATSIPYENHFDVIVFKSIIGGIGYGNNYEKQKKSFEQIYKALKPGGKLLFAENIAASLMHKKLRNRYVGWGNSWRYVTIKEMNLFLKDFSSFEIHSKGFLSVLGRNEQQKSLLASVDKTILNYIVPNEWKYMCYGVAVK